MGLTLELERALATSWPRRGLTANHERPLYLLGNTHSPSLGSLLLGSLELHRLYRIGHNVRRHGHGQVSGIRVLFGKLVLSWVPLFGRPKAVVVFPFFTY